MKSFVGVRRGDAHFEEYFIHFFGSGSIYFGISDKHTAKGRNRVACKSVFPSFKNGRTGSETASIVVLEHSESGLCEVADKIYCGVDVEKVVIRDFFAVELVEHLVEIAEEITFLMRIFAIAHSLGVVEGKAKRRGIIAIEIREYVRVVGA